MSIIGQLKNQDMDILFFVFEKNISIFYYICFERYLSKQINDLIHGK